MQNVLNQALRDFALEGRVLPPALVTQFADRPFVAARQFADEGVDLVMWSSVEISENWVRLRKDGSGLDLRIQSTRSAEGLLVREDTPQEARRNLRLIRQLQENGFQATHQSEVNSGVALIEASVSVTSAEEAITRGGELAVLLTDKLGMEMALGNLQAVRPNVIELTDQNLGAFFAINGRPAGSSKAVIFSELTQCIRCRNNWPEAINLTRDYPDLLFGFVFLNKSRAAFKRRVFMEERPEIGASGIVAPTAFFLQQGRIVNYVGRRLDEPPPSPEEIEEGLVRLTRG